MKICLKGYQVGGGRGDAGGGARRVCWCVGVNEDIQVTLMLHLCCLHPSSYLEEECGWTNDAGRTLKKILIHSPWLRNRLRDEGLSVLVIFYSLSRLLLSNISSHSCERNGGDFCHAQNHFACWSVVAVVGVGRILACHTPSLPRLLTQCSKG